MKGYSLDDVDVSPSYFWSCLTLKDDCPFLNTDDPRLYYFGICLCALYGAFAMMVLGDLTFYWSTEKFNDNIDYLINLVRKKVQKAQIDQRRLVSTRERTEKQLKRSIMSNKIVYAIRSALSSGDYKQLQMITKQQLPTPMDFDSSLNSDVENEL